jgi:NADH-quinone oxidoreductase subunit N
VFVESSNLLTLLPEIFLIGLATWLFLAGTSMQNRLFWSGYVLASYSIAGYALFLQDRAYWELFQREQVALQGPIAIDLLGHILRWIALAVGFVSTLSSTHLLRKQIACETLGLIMLAVAGAMIAAQATDLVLLFLGLELVSIPTYILLFIGRPGRESAEATAKYFYLSILSSALLLYGFSFLYGIAGTTTMFGSEAIDGIRDQLAIKAGEQNSLMFLMPLAMVLIFAGFGFKLAAVPFHFYAPDVYEGTTNVNAGILAVLPKIAGAIGLVRIAAVILPESTTANAWPYLLIISVLTMTIGNVCALWQTNLRRMMGYSSIAHAGYMLIGLTVALAAPAGAAGGISSLVFYLLVYAFGSLGTFAVLAHLSTEGREISTLDEIAGLNKSRPTAAALMAIFMFSLAGIPPLAGFMGKFMLFSSAVRLAIDTADSQTQTWMIALAVVGSLNAAIGAGYYLRVIGAMYFRSGTAPLAHHGGTGGLAAAAVCGVLTVLVGVSPGFFLSSTRLAEQSAQRLASQGRGLAEASRESRSEVAIDR